MSNPAGRASAAVVATQGLRSRKKSESVDMTPEQKKLKRLLLGSSSAKVKKAFDLGLRSNNLHFLGAYIFAELVRLEELDIPDTTKVTTKSKSFDMLRRIAEKLDNGNPSIPDSVSLELVSGGGVDLTTDMPDVEG